MNKYVRKVIRFARLRMELNYDNNWFITAAKGEGKSNFGLYLSLQWMKEYGLICVKCKNQWVSEEKTLRYNEKRGVYQVYRQIPLSDCLKCGSDHVKRITDRTFKFRKFLAYDNQEVLDLAIGDGKVSKGSPLILDEGARVLMAEDWAKKDNKRLKKVFAQMRTRNLFVLICLPRFRWSDKKISYGMATGWLRILRRGMGVFVIPDKGLSKDPWNLDNMDKTMGQYDDLSSNKHIDSIARKLFKKHSNVKSILRFPKVPQHIYDEYEVERDERALKLDIEEKKDEFTALDMRDKLIHEMYSREMSQKKISEITGISRSQVSAILNGSRK